MISIEQQIEIESLPTRELFDYARRAMRNRHRTEPFSDDYRILDACHMIACSEMKRRELYWQYIAETSERLPGLEVRRAMREREFPCTKT